MSHNTNEGIQSNLKGEKVKLLIIKAIFQSQKGLSVFYVNQKSRPVN